MTTHIAMQSFAAVPDPFTAVAEKVHITIRSMSLETAPGDERRTLFASANGLTTQIARARGSESPARRFTFFSRALEYLSTITSKLAVLGAIGAAKAEQIAAADELIANLERMLRTSLAALAASLGRTPRNRPHEAPAAMPTTTDESKPSGPADVAAHSQHDKLALERGSQQPVIADAASSRERAAGVEAATG